MGRAMKDSGVEWIGEIPEEWGILKVKNVVSCNQDKGNFDGGAYIGLENIESGTGKLIRYEGKIQVDSVVTKFTSESVLFGKLRPYLAKVARPDYSGQCSTEILVLTPAEHFDKEYLFWCLINPMFIDYVNAATFGVKMPRANWNFIGGCSLPVPPIAEQLIIGTFLNSLCSKIDSIIEKTHASIEEYKHLKQAIITQAVTKGLRGDRPMKDSGIEWIGEIPVDWNKDKVIRIFSLISSGTTPSTTDEDNFNGEVNWIQSGDINGSILYECKNKISDNTLKKYNTLTVYKAPYLILAMYGASVGNLSLSSIDACVNQACCVLSDPYIDLQYAFYSLKSAKDYLIRKAQGGGQPNINQNIVKQLWLAVPPLSEQAEITSYLDEKCAEIDALIAQKEQLLTELENYKKSLIYEYVTGKKEVR